MHEGRCHFGAFLCVIPLPEEVTMSCLKCGSTDPSDSGYCKQCGFDISEDFQNEKRLTSHFLQLLRATRSYQEGTMKEEEFSTILATMEQYLDQLEDNILKDAEEARMAEFQKEMHKAVQEPLQFIMKGIDSYRRALVHLQAIIPDNNAEEGEAGLQSAAEGNDYLVLGEDTMRYVAVKFEELAKSGK
jgi:hypothetical protein